MSANVITFFKEGNFWEFDGQKHFDASVAFSRRNRLAGKREKTLRIPEPETKTDRRILNYEGLGSIIAFALENGITWLQFERCTVSVNYIQKALQFRGANGWFWDVLDTTEDHAFDPNVPTPGGCWGEAKALLEEAAEKSRYAGLCRAASRLDEAAEVEAEAEAARVRARQLRTGR